MLAFHTPIMITVVQVLAKSIIMAMEQNNADDIAITLHQTGNHLSEWARQIQVWFSPRLFDYFRKQGYSLGFLLAYDKHRFS